MPPPSGPRTPGYRFKDGRLMIFTEDEVMLVRGWDEPSAVVKSDDSWEPFVPEFRLVAPYRRAAKKTPKPEPAADAKQLTYDLLDATPQRPKPPTISEQRKRAFDAFRFSLPKEVAGVLQNFRSHQWHLLTLLHYDKHVIDLAKANPVLAFAVGA